MTISQNAHLTFKGNAGVARHDWLRLTPAYSYSLVKRSLSNVDPSSVILDPFAGTGTTGLVAAEYGMRAKLLDLNPFLVWLVRTKCRNYSHSEIRAARQQSIVVLDHTALSNGQDISVPPIHRIERWWDAETLDRLALLKYSIKDLSTGSPQDDLLWIAFCRVMIAMSNAAFNHQSMSFRDTSGLQYGLFTCEARSHEVSERFDSEVKSILESAANNLSGAVAVSQDDARVMDSIADGTVDVIHTSPPYPNRMSYIRELRPYMYWLGYLTNSRQAGELDWQAIGGTWGVATSRLSTWDATAHLPLGNELSSLLQQITASGKPNARLLAKYVHKYFYDMLDHFKEAYRVMKSGGRATYIVGNSSYYGNIVPAERWYAILLTAVGFKDVTVEVLRKRNSNKKLFEFKVECVRP